MCPHYLAFKQLSTLLCPLTALCSTPRWVHLKKHFPSYFFTFFTTFTSFILHSYLIDVMIYSRPSQSLEIVLLDVLSTHFCLHQYFISSFPLVVFTCWSLLSFPLSCFRTTADIWHPSDLVSSSPSASCPFIVPPPCVLFHFFLL